MVLFLHFTLNTSHFKLCTLNFLSSPTIPVPRLEPVDGFDFTALGLHRRVAQKGIDFTAQILSGLETPVFRDGDHGFDLVRHLQVQPSQAIPRVTPDDLAQAFQVLFVGPLHLNVEMNLGGPLRLMCMSEFCKNS